MSALFREQAVQAAAGDQLGSVSFQEGNTSTVLTVVFLLVTVLVGVLIAFGSYTSSSTVLGVLVPDKGELRLKSTSAGTIGEVLVTQGQSVIAGQRLLVVESESPDPSGGSTSSKDLAAIAQVAQSERIRAESRRRQLQIEAESIRAAIHGSEAERVSLLKVQDSRRQQASASRKLLDRYESLRERKFITEPQYLQQELLALEHEVALEELEMQLLLLDGELESKKAALSAVGAKLVEADADLGAAHAQIEREAIQAVEDRVIVFRSPVDGVISLLTAREGQSVNGGEELLAVIPHESELQAVMRLPGKLAGRVKPGDILRVRYPDFDHQRFGYHQATIVDVSASPVAVENTAAELGAHYMVVASIPSQTVTSKEGTFKLAPGMIVEAEVLGESKKIWEWLIPNS